VLINMEPSRLQANAEAWLRRLGELAAAVAAIADPVAIALLVAVITVSILMLGWAFNRQTRAKQHAIIDLVRALRGHGTSGRR
jgi:hypothetical protein